MGNKIYYESELNFAREEISKHIVVKTFKERKKKGEFTDKYGPKDLNYNKKEKELTLFD